MKGDGMTNWTGWIIGGGLATLLTAITALVSAIKAHGRITAGQQQQGQQGNAQANSSQPR
jgi:hypothetical protein